MSRELLTDNALLLRNFDAKENDCVIHCLTEHHGKIHAYAKHAKKSKRRFGGGLDPLSLGKIEFRQAKSSDLKHDNNLYFLEHFYCLNSAHRYLNPFFLYQAANLWVECLDHLSTEGDQQTSLFLMAKNTLAELTLCDSLPSCEGVLTNAIKNTLILSGFSSPDASISEFKKALGLVEEVSQRGLRAKW